MRATIRTCTTTADVQWLLDQLRRRRTVAFDIETTCDKKTKGAKVPLWWDAGARVVSCSFSWGPGQAAVLPLSHPSWAGAGVWRPLLQRVLTALAEPAAGRERGARLVAHNARYDVGWVEAMTGLTVAGQLWWDTMIASQVLDENTSNGLKDEGSRVLGIDPWGIDLSDAESIPWPELARYNALDTIATYALAMEQVPRIRQVPALSRLMDHLIMPTQREFLDIEARGIPFDRAWAERQMVDSKDRVTTLEERLKLPDMTPADLLDIHGWTTHKVPRPKDVSWAPTSKFFKEWIDRKGAPVLKVTPKGQPSWDASVLQALQRMRDHEAWATLILEHRSLRKDIDGFLTPWLQISGQTGGRLHPAFKLATVVTGRTASEYPNAQQVPKHLKPAFRAPEGWLFLQADFSQIELRVAAWLSGDRAMLRAYRRGDDLHRLMGARIAGKEPEDVTKDERQQAKAANFGFLYGMGVNKFADYALTNYGINYTREESAAMRQTFFDQWADIEAWHERMRQTAYIDGEVRTPFGRRRRLPDIYSHDDYTRSSAERQAINSPVQATGSDLMLLAITEMADALREEPAHILGAVHDSALMICREDHLDRTLEVIGRHMCFPDTEPFGFQVPLPLAVEVEIGPAWGELDRAPIMFDGLKSAVR